MRKFRMTGALLIVLVVGACSSSNPVGDSPPNTPADTGATSESTILLREELVFDDARSLINESFATLLGSVEPGDPTGTKVRVRVEQVLSDLTPYVDTMSVTAPRPGDVVDVELFEAYSLQAARSGRVLIFVAYGRGQWHVVGQQHSIYSVGKVLEGLPGSILDGQNAKAVIEDIRIQGDDQERTMAVERGVELSIEASLP